MSKFGLSKLEHLVMLSVLRIGSRAYGVSIRQEIEQQTGKSISFGAVYTTLDRLEEKGFVSSWLGESTPERGGRPKKFFRVEASGEAVLEESRKMIDIAVSMWNHIRPLGGLAQ